MRKIIEYLQARLKVVIGTCYVLLAGIVVFACIIDRTHAHTAEGRALPIFWSLFGFIAAVIIIGVARWYGHSGIMTREDYYDDHSAQDD
ncbi:MAG: hypothetical protein GXP57_00195 [Deltaproteobacteria bacterium]|nr:hypothetical protein [Deltaproteobacteria bacterium]